MKKLISLLSLLVILSLCIFPISVSAAGSFSNYKEINKYVPGQFTDVPSTAWYAANVEIGYELGIISGKSSTTYEPDSYLKISEAVKIAACIHSIYNTGAANFTNGSPWYQTYVDYAVSNNILSGNSYNYDAYATRYQFADIFSRALPDEALQAINIIDNDAIPDVKSESSYGNAIYKLYRAGILTGNDSTGKFSPDSYITRREVAAIASRMVDIGLRKTITLTNELSAESLFAKCSPAVFYIEIYDKNGKVISTGSGFFISSNGTAVTNYHVISNAYSASIKTSSGNKYAVKGVYGYSKENDLALLKIDGDNFPYLEIGDADVSTGAKIYAIGSPLGLENTLSEGIVSSSFRLINGVNYIQVSVPLSPGSSGGALLNNKGQVIGVTTASLVDGQNINLAVPIKLINGLTKANIVSLANMPKETHKVKKITVNPASLNLEVGSSQTITVIAENMADDEYLNINYNGKIIETEWNDWTDYITTSVTIYGLAEGKTTAVISINDANDRVLTYVNVTVNVSKGSKVTGYKDFPSVPDFGAYIGVTPYLKSTFDDIYESGSMGYYAYLVDDILAVDPDSSYFEDYISLLGDWGFYFNFEGEADDIFVKREYYSSLLANKTVGISVYNMEGVDIFIVVVMDNF